MDSASPMDAMKSANLALRFILELCALAALGYWGFHTNVASWLRWVLGIGVPVAAATLWALFIAPKARVSVGDSVRVIMQGLVFGLTAAGLYGSGLGALAVVFVVVVVVNALLMAAWNQEGVVSNDVVETARSSAESRCSSARIAS